MSREIKFRGKRIDNGEWVYGYYVADNQWKKDELQRHYIFTGYIDSTDFYEKHYVDPETVGQFCGLEADDIRDHPDSHSVHQDIYGDDIVFIIDIGEQRTSRVTFEDGMFCVDYWGNKEPLCNFTEEMRVFVIGNVHDNPELNSELLAQE